MIPDCTTGQCVDADICVAAGRCALRGPSTFPIRQCEQCGDWFAPKPRARPDTRFCSGACRSRARYAEMRTPERKVNELRAELASARQEIARLHEWIRHLVEGRSDA